VYIETAWNEVVDIRQFTLIKGHTYQVRGRGTLMVRGSLALCLMLTIASAGVTAAQPGIAEMATRYRYEGMAEWATAPP
jgi:hypothetical protein